MNAQLRARKQPRQQRAQETVDAILDGAMQLLVELGYDKSSTNKIAQRAGVSVGSLYQYFPNKEAIVQALFERHTDRMLALLENSIVSFLDASLEDGLRTYVQTMVDVHTDNPQLHKVMVQQVLHLGFEHLNAVEGRARALVRIILEHKRDEILPDDTELAAFVLVTTVETLVHRALQLGEFEKEAVVEEVCAVALRYLGLVT